MLQQFSETLKGLLYEAFRHCEVKYLPKNGDEPPYSLCKIACSVDGQADC